jgi:Ca2+-binding EF-hand superfamily protein
MSSSDLGPTLAQHVRFFDADGDGIIKRRELRSRLLLLGLPRWRATFSSLIFGVFRGPKSSGRWTTDINVAELQRSILRGSTGVFDRDGHATVQRVNELLDRLDPEETGRVTNHRIDVVCREDAASRRDYRDTRAGWQLFMTVARNRDADGNPYLTRDQVRSLYNGTFFYEVALERLAAQDGAAGSDPRLKARLERDYEELLHSEREFAPAGAAEVPRPRAQRKT